MPEPTLPFYVAGGTLAGDVPSYVERRADRELQESLRRGEFCYVLTARQTGKSSLMVRTAARLAAAGTAVVVLDLTAIGQNVTADQWYDGLQNMMGQQLGLEEELEAFWQANQRHGPLQRFMGAVRNAIFTTETRRHGVFTERRRRGGQRRCCAGFSTGRAATPISPSASVRL